MCVETLFGDQVSFGILSMLDDFIPLNSCSKEKFTANIGNIVPYMQKVG